MAQRKFDVIVVGEGVAGLTAAGALARRGVATATLEAQLFGGLVLNVNELEPGPEGRHVSGAEFASELVQANADLGVTSIQEPVSGITHGGEWKSVATSGGTYDARHVIIASGARLRRLGVPGEAEFEGRGVSRCADCDGPMYQNEEVVVVGGGDSALQEALVLANYCKRVHIVHRGPTFRAHSRFAQRVLSNERISPLWNATVFAVSGSSMVEGVGIRHADGRSETLPCAGVFAYIGLEPNADPVPTEIARDSAGFVMTRDRCETTAAGVWAVGAIRSGCGGTLEDAMRDARDAADAICERIA